MTAKDLDLLSRATVWIAALGRLTRMRYEHPAPRSNTRNRRRVILRSRLEAADRLREESERRKLWM